MCVYYNLLLFGKGWLRAASEEGAHLHLLLIFLYYKKAVWPVWQSEETILSGSPAFPSGASSPPPSLASSWATVFRGGQGEASSYIVMQ